MTVVPTTEAVVLIVDDSPETLSMLSQLLDQEGLTVLIALDGDQALNIARRMKPDIVLLDAIMPGKDGFHTCRALKQDALLKTIPVIFMTGLSDSEHVVMGLEAGGVDYVTKPINAPELLARMRVHLNNSRMTQSAHAALDSTGQTMFTTNRKGLISWATPNALALLATAHADAAWQSRVLAPLLCTWLDHAPEAGHKLAIEAPGKKLQCRYLNEVSAEEYLFKLTESDTTNHHELLKRSFMLTDREAEVLHWIANGKTNREIAQILDLSPRTVNKHLEQVFKKMSVENRTSAASIAIRLLNEGGG